MAQNHHKITNSSSIAHIDYHEDKSILEICFTNGGTYRYSDCPKSVYETLKTADSAGRHFLKHIKDNYKGTKL